MTVSIKQFQGFKKIILTTDFSDPSDNASSYAFSMAKHYDATLHIVHVVDTSCGDEDLDLPSLALEKEMVDLAEAMLEKKFSRRLHKLPKHKTVVLLGIPHEMIIDYAKKIKADLIVMGTYGKSGLGRVLLGSTTERVMRRVHCPVLPIHHEPS
jgi:nucleotide-binding universal stress UspA family protein